MSLQAIQQAQRVTENLAMVAAKGLTDFFNSLDWENKIGSRDQLLEFYLDLASYYGDQSALLSADLYAELREEFRGLKRFVPELFSEISEEKIKANIRYQITPVFQDDNVDQALKNVQGLVYDHMRMIGDQTLYENANRDPNRARYFRIAEANACSWCLMVSSRGAEFISRDKAAAARHERCRCETGCTWDANEIPYDVDAVYEKWQESLEGTSSE